MFVLLAVACAKAPVPLVAEETPEAAPTVLATVADPIPSASESEPELTPTVSYTLRRGETLAHFARWSGLPIEVVAETSGLSVTDDRLPVGTRIVLPLDPEARARVEVARDAHHTKRVEGWLGADGGEIGTEFHTVSTGESAWTIAQDHHDLPVWVVETYNPQLDLDHLRPGQQLMLPVTADTLAADGTGE